MKTIRVQIDPTNPASLPEGRVDLARVDATTEEQIAEHQAIDELEALQDAAKTPTKKAAKRLLFSNSGAPDRNRTCIKSFGNSHSIH